MTADELARQVNGELSLTGSLAEHLERRLIALELVAATPWPVRLLARARLGRQLRRSVRHFPGDSFAERRISAVTTDWLQQ